MHEKPDYSGLSPEHEQLVPTLSNNQLRCVLAQENQLKEEDWKAFVNANLDLAVAHRQFWGIEVDEGWVERSWNTPDGQTYSMVEDHEAQIEYAKKVLDEEANGGGEPEPEAEAAKDG
jgi:hypothetical protein